MAHVLQFSTDDIDELIAKLSDIAEQIPAMRERMLRQYLYSLKAEKSKKRWIDYFKKKNPEAQNQSLQMLRDNIEGMLNKHKISKGEALKLLSYAETLHE